eukprot:TRINITY_DN1879_c0_g1::TRINITY_DN1879_c0_g1_i2::g.14015::m.14015 TRINITY_DN1879_c0_g1::TRINITY_DN1879_c0_g1_i2::g.14015  ORF type:complete len:101 (+),score=32.76,DUF543/PF04418.7/7.8e-18 TRINITY_DN1879_c0_g1_i2:42-305(+)
MSANSEMKAIPSELKVADMWDRTLEKCLRSTAYGALTGSFVALLLFRAPISRTSIISLSAGFGLGSAYTESKLEFERQGIDFFSRSK